jgi:uncharacterized protein (TIGR03083 family)
MAKTDVWPVIHAERHALADQLEAISDEAWTTDSWCSEWTVQDVLAHMTATAKLSGTSFFPKLIGSGFSLKKMQAKDIARELGASGPDTLRKFTAELGSTGRPPGPVETMLGEVLVHSEDIRRPLGLSHAHSPEAVIVAADFYQGSNLIVGTKKRIAGITLRATDGQWSHGDGPPVEGPMLSLLLAMTGRKQALDDLSGEGVAVLRSRV